MEEAPDGKVMVIEEHHEEEEVRSRLFAPPDINEVKKEMGSMWSWVASASTSIAEKASKLAEQAEVNARELAQSNHLSTFLNSKMESGGVLPWNEPASKSFSGSIKDRCLELSKDDKSFLIPPPDAVSFEFRLEEKRGVIDALTEADPNLKAQIACLVPAEIDADQFWKNYFYRVSLILEAYQENHSNTAEVPTVEDNEEEETEDREEPDRKLSQESLNLDLDVVGWGKNDDLDINDENFDMLDDDELLASAGIEGASDDDDVDDEELEERIRAELKLG